MMRHSQLFCSLALISLLLLPFFVIAQPTPGQRPATATPDVIPIPPEAKASPDFNVDAATNAYLAQMPAESRAKSDAYFEGGYWLILWDFLYGAAISLLLLNLRWSAKMRDLAERVTRFKWVHTFVYWAEYLIVTTILGFPLAVYEGFTREWKYGLATQTFGQWMGDQVKGLLVALILGGVLVVPLFGIVRKTQRTWWAWGALVFTVFTAFVALIAPVFIFPIFNKITKLEDPKVTIPILSMARANGIPAHDVYEIDASRQTTRMSANVSGVGNTMRITMNDNLLKRGSLEEIESVMGHEMGHYVLNHVYKGIVFFGVMYFIGFGLLYVAINRSLARWGEKWQIRGIGDTAVLPLVALWATFFSFLATPVQNTLIRVQEHEADMYGLNASAQPDGFAQAAIHLGEYRKMSPGKWEEIILFDHPSGRNRIHDAMQWKAEHLKQ
ncbi:MAG TPA: M48 family metallopeptidase [Terriglobales bacterium]